MVISTLKTKKIFGMNCCLLIHLLMKLFCISDHFRHWFIFEMDFWWYNWLFNKFRVEIVWGRERYFLRFWSAEVRLMPPKFKLITMKLIRLAYIFENCLHFLVFIWYASGIFVLTHVDSWKENDWGEINFLFESAFVDFFSLFNCCPALTVDLFFG